MYMYRVASGCQRRIVDLLHCRDPSYIQYCNGCVGVNAIPIAIYMY
jgi:hypothetical protein